MEIFCTFQTSGLSHSLAIYCQSRLLPSQTEKGMLHSLLRLAPSIWSCYGPVFRGFLKCGSSSPPPPPPKILNFWKKKLFPASISCYSHPFILPSRVHKKGDYMWWTMLYGDQANVATRIHDFNVSKCTHSWSWRWRHQFEYQALVLACKGPNTKLN